MKRDREILSKYLPSAAVERIMKWLKEYKVQLSITRSRNTKLGDYRSPVNGGAHRISINHDLNQYAFLITLVHEIAHLLVWEKYKTKALPHGKEWKGSFKELMKPFIQEGIFPEELKIPLMDYLQNAKASSGSDQVLTRILRKYDGEEVLVLEDLPPQTSFRIPSGRAFIKGEKLRKRYRCICLHTRKTYLVNPLIKVYPLEKQ